MVNQVRTLDFLPEIFQTETNDQFLSSTLDVLTKQPNMTRVQGYIGNKYGYAIEAGDNYVTETTQSRSNYQLDPAVVFLKEDTQIAQDFIDYPGIIAALTNGGGVTSNHNKLFSNTFYSWDSFADIDKLVNYAQYYWLPLGPDAILIYEDVDVTDILGKTNYTAPNGLAFVNGLKVNFSGTVTPSNYANVDYYVEGVGTSITLVPASELLCTEVTGGGIYTPWDNDPYDTVDWSISLYVPIQPDYIVINRSSRDRNAWSRGNRWFHQGVIDATVKYNGDVTNNQYNTQTRAQRPIVEFQGNMSLYNSGKSYAAIVDFIDTRTKDALSTVAGSNGIQVKTDVNRTSNRVSTEGIVVNDTTNLVEGMTVTFSGNLPIELDATKEYVIRSIDNVLSTITVSLPPTVLNGTTTYHPVIKATVGSYDMKVTGISEIGLLNDTTVVFANDNDINVRKTVYKVTTVEAGADAKKIIALTPLPNVTVETGSQIYVAAGPGDYLGQAWRFEIDTTGVIRPAGDQGWTQSQKKIAINQSPLFDIVDDNEISFSDTSFYMNSSFAGSKLFSYTIGTGTNDSVLGFATTYSSPANTGDFLFTVHMNSDKFTYTNDSTGSTITKMISDGYAQYRPTTTATVKRTGWVKAVAPSVQYQVFIFDVTDVNKSGLVCDVAMSSEAQTLWAPIKIYKNGEFIDSSYYKTTVDTTIGTTIVTFNDGLSVGDQVSVQLISDQVSKTAYYQIPSNLQSNPFNTQISSVAAGDLKNYYNSIFGNAPNAAGVVFGQNNLGNLGDLAKYGNTIIQNSASLLLPGVFLRKSSYNIQDALQYNCDEYMDYKHTLLQLAYTGDYSVYQTVDTILDDIIYQISSAKNESDSFYWSDMIVSGSPFSVNTYSFGAAVTVATFATSRVYDFANANYYGLAVYITETVDGVTTTSQLIRGVDYFPSTTEPSVTIKRSISTSTTITVKEYNQTWGSYIPNTPTKLGLYPATIPHVKLDATYTQPTYFIVGHDGSHNRLYGTYTDGKLDDFRDLALLEFETRIYNNLKVSGDIPLQYTDVFPGQWRKTDYSWEEILPTYTSNFLNWVGKNKLGDYRRQVFSHTNSFSFNYNKATNTADSTLLKQGNWRGIYNWFYDTSNPADAPWEMLGFTTKPQWWDSRYGSAPYTTGNMLMWQDIADGRVWNNGTPYIDSTRVRPGLLKTLPVDDAGALIDPLVKIIKNYDSLTFERGWVAGDQGPTETSYLKSSSWPFDLMKLMSVLKPADFYNLNADRDMYKYDSDLDQYLFNGRYHLDPADLIIYGNGTAKHSYINWVVDYINQTGTDGQASVATTLKNIDVRLTYKLAGFSDKQYLRFLTENTAPSATSNSLLIPDDSYSVLLYDNVPSDKVTYSSVIIQKTDRGYTVWGNSITNPYFKTVAPKVGPYQKLTYGNTTVQLSTVYDAASSVSIAYGTEFYTIQGVSEFLRNYGRWLTEHGVVFENSRDDALIDWTAMIGEFVSWAQQMWETGSIISLNPNAKEFKMYKSGLIVQPLTLHKENFILNQNLITLKSQNMAVLRNNEEFSVRVLSDGDTIAYTNLHLSTVEHAIVFDNQTVFGDTIYNTDSGLRQTRLVMQGKKTADWSGYVNADGFILNQADISEWDNSTKYPKGQIVLYKNKYWFAKELIQPSDTFDYTLWTESNYENIKQGLLPNPSTAAYESSQLYDIQQANLEQDEDLLAFGLIGFRPRDYMSLASLSDVTQINVYKNMISSKGTNKSTLAFKGATPLQGDLDYDVRENWAIKTSNFGSVLNSNFVETPLYQNLLTGNPAIIGFGDAMASTVDFSTIGFKSGVQQKVAIGDIAFKGKKKNKGGQDYKYQNDLINYGRSPDNANFLPSYSLTYVEERGLPTAGYVNIDDVDYYAYNLSDLNSTATNISDLYRGDVVWVANYNSKWDVFTPVSIGTVLSSVRNNLNDTVTLTFSEPHGLLEDDPFVVVDFDDRVNGYYTATTIVDLRSVVIDLTLPKTVVTLTGTGITFKLYSVRVEQASNLSLYTETVPFAEFSTRLSWVDEDTSGDWSVLGASPVYEKQTISIDATLTKASTTVAVTSKTGVIVGQLVSGTGIVNGTTVSAISATTNTITISVAPTASSDTTLTFENTRTGYGKSVAYTSAIGELVVANNGLYKNGSLLQTINGITSVVASGTTAICSSPSTLYVFDFNLNTVSLSTLYTDETYIIVSLGTMTQKEWNELANRDVAYNVNDTTTYKTYKVGDEIIPKTSSSTLSGTVRLKKLVVKSLTVANNGVITLSRDTNWLYVANNTTLTTYFKVGTTYINTGTTTVGSEITSLATAKDGSKVIVGASNQALLVGDETYSEGGVVYVYDRASRSYLQDVLTNKVFTVSSAITGEVAQVYINATLQEASSYSVVGSTVTFTVAPPVGTTIYINYGALTKQQTITSSKPHIGANFGRSVATNRYGAEITVGAPYELATVNEVKNVEGAVYRFTNAGQRYGTVTATVSESTDVAGTLYIDGFEVNYSTSSKLANPTLPASATNPEMPSSITDNKRNRVAYQINSIEPTNVVATYGDTATMTLSNKVGTAAVPNDQIDIVGATEAALSDIGITPYIKTQVINDKNLDTNSQFGWTVAMNQDDSTRDSIIVSARSVDTFSETTFDFTNDLNAMNDCIFDNGATTFIDKFPFTGGVYQYDYLSSNSETIDAPGKYTFGQYCIIPTTDSERSLQSTAPHYGSALSFTDGVITVGSPDWYKSGTGRVTTFKIDSSSTKTSSWYTDKQPLPRVDVNRLSTISIYDTETNKTLDRLDYIDPAQGKMLSAVETNIDIIGLVDPAVYSTGTVWGANRVGTTWLDTSNIRLMNYNQPDVTYNSRYFGRAFPGSTADIYTWISSSVLPVDYSGSGYTSNFNDYVSATIIDKSSNTLTTEYYFWVKGYDQVPVGKTLSPSVLSQYILNPANSGVAFLGALTTNTVALFNAQDSIQSHSSALHLGYSVGNNSDRGHQDWSLIQDGNDESFLAGVPSTVDQVPFGMYLKYVTSFMGADLSGLSVPDTTLPELVRYGTSFRPRQSMFVDRALALKNFIQYANDTMAKYTITETRGMYLLNQSLYINGEVSAISSTNIYITTQEGKTVTGLYEGQAVTVKGTSYGGIEANKSHYITKIGTDDYGQYITVSDSTNGSTIGLTENVGTMSIKIYDTTDYWTNTTWWATGYSSSTKVTLEVQSYTDLMTIGQGDLVASSYGNVTLTEGLVARVIKNGQGVNEYYSYSSTGWTRVGLQRGTIQIKSELYTTTQPIPSMEIYHIIRWITEQLYVNELLIENNQSLMMMFNLIQSEGQQQQNYLPWLNKTSLIDVKHTIRQLKPYKQYKRDTRELVEGYLKEVKPYHVFIKDFSFTYDGIEEYNGVFTDFDLPAQYNSSVGKFLSPQLVSQVTTSGQYLSTDSIWKDVSYSDWYNHFGLTISNQQVSTILVTALTNDISNTSTSIVVDEATVLPVRGTILIGNEEISYTILNRKTNTISGLTRGINFQQPQSYTAGTNVYLLPEPVMVMDSGRGYTSLPVISAYFDTTEYPYGPRTPAVFTPVLSETKLVSVTLTNAGDGYPVLPEIRVGASSISGLIYTNQIDSTLNQISIAGHPFVDGDCVVVSDIEDDSTTKSLKNNQYYYVKSIDENTISLYRTYKEAINGYTTVETFLSFSDTANNIITFDSATNIDKLPFVTGDKIKIVYASKPASPEYYYVENLGIDGVLNGAPKIAIYSTKEKAMTGYSNDRITPSGSGSISNTPRTDSTRIALLDNVTATIAVTARVSIFTDNLPVREMKVNMKFDRTSYLSYAKDWNAETGLFSDAGWGTGLWGQGIYYSKNDLAVYDGVLYRANRNLNTTELADTFNLAYWTEVDSGDGELTAADRIAGFYKPTGSMAGFTMTDMSQLMTGVTNPYPVVKNLPFSDTKTYAFLAGQVDLDTDTIQLRETAPEVVTYVERITGTSNNEISLTALPAATSVDKTLFTLKSTDNVRIGDRIKFDGALFGNIVSNGIDSEVTLKNKNYVVSFINSSKDVISISDTFTNGSIGNSISLTTSNGYMTIKPVEYTTSNIYANGIVSLNTTDFVSVGDSVRFSNVSVTVDVNRTYSSTNPATPSQLLVSSTANIAPGMKIEFSGDVSAANISNVTPYYVKQVIDTNNITISDALMGPVHPLTSSVLAATAKVTGSFGKYDVQTATKVSANGYITVSNTASYANGMNVWFTGTNASPVFGGLNTANGGTNLQSADYTLTVQSATEITLSYSGTPITVLTAGTGKMTAVVEANGIVADTNYFVTSVANSNITLSTTLGGTSITTMPISGTMLADSSQFYVTEVTADTNNLTLNSIDAVKSLSIGDEIYFTGNAIGGLVPLQTYTVKSLDYVTNKVTLTDTTGLFGDTPSSTERMSLWRVKSSVKTSYANGDMVKVVYTFPTSKTTEYYYVTVIDDTTISLRTTDNSIVTIPDGASGTVVKPQTIVALTDPISYSVGTALQMLFEQSSNPTNFGLTNYRTYWVGIIDSRRAGVYLSKDDAENDTNRIPLLSQNGGQFLYGSNYDTIIKAPNGTAATQYDIVGAPFESGYSPEELVAGIVTDGINFTVTTRPGSTWDPLSIASGTNSSNFGGTGFNMVRLIRQAPSTSLYYSDGSKMFSDSTTGIQFKDIVVNPMSISVYGNTSMPDGKDGQTRLTPGDDYTVDWINEVIYVIGSAVAAYTSFDLVIYEAGNGSHLIRSSSKYFPIKKVQDNKDKSSGITYHSEIHLDVPYCYVETPNETNYWLSTLVSVGSITTDMKALTYLTNTTHPEYSSSGHYTIEPLRPYDQVNDPYNPAKIVFTEEYDNATDYASFVLTTNVIGMFVVSTEDINSSYYVDGIEYVDFVVPITDLAYARSKLDLQLNGTNVSNYTVVNPTDVELASNKGFATITFKLSDLSLYDNIKVTYGSNGASTPLTQRVAKAEGLPKDFIEPVTTKLGSVSITSTGGVFSCTSSVTLKVGDIMSVSGLLSGTGSIAGYVNPTTYYIIATNGTTNFTLSTTSGGTADVVTTLGSTTGLSFNVVQDYTVPRLCYTLNSFLGDDNYSSIKVTEVKADGYFYGSSSIQMKVNDTVTITGELIGTATITGYHSPIKYYIADTDGYSKFSLTSYFGGIPDVTVTPGTTVGLTFSIENNLVVEIDGVRVDGPSPTQIYRKIIQVDKDELKISYPTPVYGISEFDIEFFTVLVNGSEIPQFNPVAPTEIYWNLNYDFANGKFYQMDADFINDAFNTVVTEDDLATGAWGFFDDGTPFDNQSSFNVVLNPNFIKLKDNDIITLSYQVPGQVPPDTFTIEVDEDKLGGTLNVLNTGSVFKTGTSKVAITTFGRTTGQSLLTQRVTDATVNLIPRLSSLEDLSGARIPGIKFSLTSPPLITLDTVHSLTNKSPLQQVMIHGTSASTLDGRRFYVSSTNYYDMSTVQDSSKQVYLYNVDEPSNTNLTNRWDTSSASPFTALTGTSYIQLLNAVNSGDSTLSINPLVITQPDGYKLTDVSRLFVSIIYSPDAPGPYIGHREYVPTNLLSFTQFGDVSTLLIQKAIAPGDQVLITSMVPTTSPDENKFRINNTWNTVSGVPNTPKLHRENQFTRTYVTEVINDINTGELSSFRVNNPQALVKTAVFSGSDSVSGARDVVMDPESGIYYCLVDNVNNRQVSDIKITTVAGVAITGFESIATSNTTTVKIIFSSNPGVTKVNVTISAGNTLMINGEELQFSSIVLEQSNPSYGLISGFKRGRNSTGAKEIKLYDIVQGVLDENISDAGNAYKNWYSNNIKTAITANATGGTYTFTYPTGVNSDGSTASDVIGSVVAKDTIAFITKKTHANGKTYTDYVSSTETANIIYTNASTEEYVYATYASTGGSDTTMTMVSTAGITKGMYVSGKGITAGTTVTQIFGRVITLSSAVTQPEGEYSFYNIPTANVFNFNIDADNNIRKIAVGSTVSFKHDGNLVTIDTIDANGNIVIQNAFTVTNSYANTQGGLVSIANSTTWTIETAESPAARVGDEITTQYHDFDIANSYQSGNTWIIKTSEQHSLVAADTTVYLTHSLDLPLQLDGNSTIADFLNKQVR
jgi:hypothetical protein